MSKFNLHAFADEAGQELKEQISALCENGYEGLEIRKVEGQNVSTLTIEQAKEIWQIYEYYTELMKKNNLIDFDLV